MTETPAYERVREMARETRKAEAMKFPEVPGKTPYDRFVNLVRHVIAIPKADVEDKKRPKPRRKKSAAILTLVLLIASCAMLAGCYFAGRGTLKPTTVKVAQTEPAQACARQCDILTETCTGPCDQQAAMAMVGDFGAGQRCMDGCAEKRDTCRLSCPK